MSAPCPSVRAVDGRDAGASPAASLSAAGPRSRFTDDLEAFYVGMLAEAGADVSARLGYRAGTAL